MRIEVIPYSQSLYMYKYCIHSIRAEYVPDALCTYTVQDVTQANTCKNIDTRVRVIDTYTHNNINEREYVFFIIPNNISHNFALYTGRIAVLHVGLVLADRFFDFTYLL